MPPEFDATKIHAWVHNLDPFAIQFSETFGIRWYGLAYMAGFVAGALIMKFLARRGRRTLPADQVVDFITYVVLGTMFGGRLGYALFYDTSLLTSWNAHLNLFGTDIPVWNLLAVWEGGMASHGGIAGIVIAAVIYAKRQGLSWLHLGDLTTLGGSLGIFFGRMANFINGELQGRVVHSAVPWAVKFPSDMFHWLRQSPQKLIQLTEVAREVGIPSDTWVSWMDQLHASKEIRGNVEAVLDKIILALESGNEKVADLMQPLLEARHPSQIYQGLMEGLLVFIACFLLWYKPRKPGVIGGLFLTLYAVMRIIGEQFREPDAHIGYEFLGLTRGQILSIVMLLASAALWIWAARRPAEVIGGWGPEAQRLKKVDP
jgi:phosphatidylglycerol---prolipoprotein diacylglyceryl transferase